MFISFVCSIRSFSFLFQPAAVYRPGLTVFYPFIPSRVMVSALEHTFHSLRLYLFYSFHPTWSARSLCALLRPLHEARLEVPLHSCGGAGGAGGHTRSEPPRPGARSPPARNAHMSSCLVVGLFFFFFQSTSKVKPVFHLTVPRSICDQPPALGGVRRLQPRAFLLPAVSGGPFGDRKATELQSRRGGL